MTDSQALTAAIRRALAEPPHAVSYALTLELRVLFAGKFVLQSTDHEFDVEEFARAGHCTLLPRPDIVERELHAWQDDAWGTHVAIGASSVAWSAAGAERRFDYVTVTWEPPGCETSVRFLAAASRADAEAFFEATCCWQQVLAGSVLVFAFGRWTKTRNLYADIRKTRREDLILPAQMREEIIGDLQRFVDRKADYDRLGIPWKRGVLLAGPPGNGKTMCIKVLANTLRVIDRDGKVAPIDCLYVRSLVHPQVPDHYTIPQVFQRARAAAPCLLIFEDLDSQVTDENRSMFLNELDGLAVNSGIITIASTNHAERLDPALRNRPSRFDRTWRFELPAPAERTRYLSAWRARSQATAQLTEAECARVAELTDGFSYAYLNELMVSSLMRWMDDGDESVALVAVVEPQVRILREQMSEATGAASKSNPQREPLSEMGYFDHEGDDGDDPYEK